MGVQKRVIQHGLDHVKSMMQAKKVHKMDMAVQIKELEGQLGRLKLDDRSMQILQWPNQIEVDELHKALEGFDSAHDQCITNASGLKKMPF